MKKIILALLVVITGALFAIGNDPDAGLEIFKPEFSVNISPRDAEFGDNYYDYMMGSYTNSPVKVGPQGRVFIAYHSVNAEGGTRRVYSAVVEDGYVGSPGQVNMMQGYTEGYPSLWIDHETGNPFYTFHASNNSSNPYVLPLFWDNVFSQDGTTSNFSSFGVALDNANIPGISWSYGNDFIWPYVYVMDHPTDSSLRRIIVVALNASTAATEALGLTSGSNGYPQASNVIIARADFNKTDTEGVSGLEFDAGDLEWTYTTIPEIDNMLINDKVLFTSKVVKATVDGKIFIIGTKTPDETSSYYDGFSTTERLVTVYNDNYGEGAYTVSEFDLSTENIDIFPQDWISEQDIKIGFTPYTMSHSNATIDSNNNFHIPVVNSTACYKNNAQGDGSYTYWPLLMSLKEFIVNPTNGHVEVKNIFPKTTDGSLYNYFDGINPSEDSNGLAYVPFWDNTNKYTATYETRIVKGMIGSTEVLCSVWTDGTYLNRATGTNADPELEAWIDVPEIAIAFSTDNGATWGDPLFISAQDTDVANSSGIEELRRTDGAKMLPVFLMPSENLIDVSNEHPGQSWARLPIVFLDDNTYGSSIQQQGAGNGGKMRYMEVDIRLDNIPGLTPTEEVNIVSSNILQQNRPNPFNPKTTIKYDLPESGNVNLAIYNVKGQLVKTLVNGHQNKGSQTVTWTGMDDFGNQVSSGVYFYKVKTGTQTEMKKMVLIK